MPCAQMTSVYVLTKSRTDMMEGKVYMELRQEEAGQGVGRKGKGNFDSCGEKKKNRLCTMNLDGDDRNDIKAGWKEGKV